MTPNKTKFFRILLLNRTLTITKTVNNPARPVGRIELFLAIIVLSSGRFPKNTTHHRKITKAREQKE